MRANQRLIQRYTANVPPGTLRWIGLRPARKQPMVEAARCEAVAGLGLAGDRRCAGTPGSSRQVTLISAEHIQLIGQYLNIEPPAAALLRRNLVVSNINLQLLRHQQFRIGEALFEGTAACHPCGRMEQVLGKGGFAAMYGQGGLCAKILQGGNIAVGDAVRIEPIVTAADDAQIGLL